MREYCYALLLLMKGGGGLLMLQHAPYSSICSPPILKTIPSSTLQQQKVRDSIWYARIRRFAHDARGIVRGQ